MELQIIEVIKETGLANPQADLILSTFKPLAEQAKSLIEISKTIKVTDISQVKEMGEARKTRLALKEIRVEANKTRKELKEEALKYGNSIQGVYNLIEENISKAEIYLEDQEKFAEKIEEERKGKILAQRSLDLSKYVEDISFYNLKDMSDEAFTVLLSNSKMIFDKKKEDERLAEEKRIKEEKEKEEEAKRNKIEIENLKKEKEEKEKKDKKEKAIADAKLKEEQDARKKLEDEKKEREELERKEKEEKEEKERQSKLAPEKDKLIAYAETIKTIKAPEDLSKAGLEIVKQVEAKLLEISQEIKLKIKEL